MERELLPRIPVSTYRLQLNYQFNFSDAKEIIHYLHDLGITDIYCSPYFKANKKSLHGYDIVDPNTLNPEIGTEEAYNELIRELHSREMGQVLDIVPNHMCITSKDNLWWMDVLENGPSSFYAVFFDIDWDPVKNELKDKVLLPILGDQYGNVLDNQELRLIFDEGAFFINYYEHRLPIRPQTYTHILKYRLEELEKALSSENLNLIELLSINTALGHLPSYTEKEPEKIKERNREKEIIKKRLWSLYNESSEIRAFLDENIAIYNGVKGDQRSFDLLDSLISAQVYRLSYWRVATEEINYRRFFDINELAAIRMEDPIVYSESHRLIFELIKDKKINGLRVDHPDGLYNPSEYFKCLQRDCFLQKTAAFTEGIKEGNPEHAISSDKEQENLSEYEEMLLKDAKAMPFYIVGEKILIRGERIPEDWPIFSTTGYVFLNLLNGVFVETTNSKAFDDIYARFIRMRINYQDIVYEKKKLIMQVAMSSEINMLCHYLNRISEKDRHTRDFTLNSLTAAIIEVIAFLPVYRTYIYQSEIDERDRRYIEHTVSKAKRKNPAISESIFNFLKEVLLLSYPAHFDENDKKEWVDFVMRFQQITGPVMAKGVEDTAFYVYNRLVSLNEVGGSPDRFGIPLEAFHGQNMERIKFWPYALITTATHDSKRSEDVRARINSLSEIPYEWKECLMRWSRLNKKKKPLVNNTAMPDRNEEYLLYQTLIGAWPVSSMDEAEYDIFKKRIKDYMLKASREAKVNTSWISPNIIYEEALMKFIEGIMNPLPNNQFLRDFTAFQKNISNYGMYNSLSQTLLKITSPGVPDFYQGTEIWDFSLVDPDNRRPVDYSIRKKMLEELKKRESEVLLPEIARDLTINKENGQIKLYLIYKALNYRKANCELFKTGSYIPIEAMGGHAENVCSFARGAGDSEVIVAAPRFFTRLIKPEEPPFGAEIWNDTAIVMPSDFSGRSYRNIFTNEPIKVNDNRGAPVLYLSDLFRNFPVALLERID